MSGSAQHCRHILRSWLRGVGLTSGIGFIGWLLWRLLHDPEFVATQFAWRGFAEAILLGVLANAMVGVAFSALVAKTVSGIESRRRLSAFYYAQLAKYVPGRVTALLVQRSVLSGPHASIATLIANMELTIASCWLCTGAAITLLCINATPLLAPLAGAITIAVGALLIRLNWKPLLATTQRLVGRPRPSGSTLPASTPIDWSKATRYSIGMFALPAASNFVLLVDGMQVASNQAAHLSALLLLSWVGGMMAFVFPAGIGVRELIFFAIGGAATRVPDAGLLAAVALASRLVQIFTDLAGVLIFFCWRSLAQRTGRLTHGQ